MQLTVVPRIVGLLLMVFSLTMLPPAAVELIYRDGQPPEALVAAGLVEHALGELGLDAL